MNTSSNKSSMEFEFFIHLSETMAARLYPLFSCNYLIFCQTHILILNTSNVRRILNKYYYNIQRLLKISMRCVEEIVDKKLELRRSKVSYVCQTDDPKAMPTVSKKFCRAPSDKN